VQRASSDLKLNPHLHVVFLDGMYTATLGGGLVFRALPHLSTTDVADVLQIARARILRYLERRAVIRLDDEALFRLYRTKGYGRARAALTRLTDAMAHSSLPEVQTFRNTMAQRGPCLLRLAPHERAHRRLQRQREARDSGSLRSGF